MNGPTGWRRVGRSAGVALLVVVGMLYLSSGLVVPVVPWLFILNAAGAYAFIKTLVWSRERWWIALAGPAAMVVFWWVYVNLGGALLGWTA